MKRSQLVMIAYTPSTHNQPLSPISQARPGPPPPPFTVIVLSTSHSDTQRTTTTLLLQTIVRARAGCGTDHGANRGARHRAHR